MLNIEFYRPENKLGDVLAEVAADYKQMPAYTSYYFNLLLSEDFINADDRRWLIDKFIESSSNWNTSNALLLKFKLRSMS